MNLPKKINPNPIIDAIVELRFSSQLHPSAIFGVFFNALKDKYNKVEELPILQLPEQLRNQDPNLAYKPLYKISNGDYSIQIGPKVLTFGASPNYEGWSSFSSHIFYCLDTIFNLNIITEINRLGIRYINFFNFDIFEKINVKLLFDNKEQNLKNTVIRTQIDKDEFGNTLQIANNAKRNLNGKMLTGSLIDIDTFIEHSLDDFLKIYKDKINQGHFIEKELFFGLLNKDFLNEFKPEY